MAIEQRPTAVYRLYDSADRLLYVGSAFDPTRRLRQHAAAKPWWSTVDPTRTRIEWYGEREAARVEHEAARTEHPLHGSPKKRIIVGYPLPRRRTPAARLASAPAPRLPPHGTLTLDTSGTRPRYRVRVGERTSTITLANFDAQSARHALAALRRTGYRPPTDPSDAGYGAYQRLHHALTEE
ncbi:MAG: GIY-YIG nuclease family protein [Streptomyces sp.]|nr:GIY-YIG nuclease family protein [Streptomyces sp.]NUS11405.1 GIY-YIG nuclease family protein [Streptomyces sp.]NUS23454.1 GIY-YIG nuclease family protein [Streptomyces sp.]